MWAYSGCECTNTLPRTISLFSSSFPSPLPGRLWLRHSSVVIMIYWRNNLINVVAQQVTVEETPTLGLIVLPPLYSPRSWPRAVTAVARLSLVLTFFQPLCTFAARRRVLSLHFHGFSFPCATFKKIWIQNERQSERRKGKQRGKNAQRESRNGRLL